MRLLCWLLTLAGVACSGERWEIRYFYDEDSGRLVLRDLVFVSAQRGIACGMLSESGRQRGALLTSEDGGRTWSLGSAPEPCLSLCAVTGGRLWMVAPKGLYLSEDGGAQWRRVEAPAGLLRVFFLDGKRGWAVGTRKGAFATLDGGQTWQSVAAAADVRANPEYTSFRWIAFADPMRGMIVGGYEAPRHEDEGPIPDWVDLRRAQKRREWPSLGIVLETQDGGRSWRSSVTTMFGQISRVRLSADGCGLALVEFRRVFEWPSEVYVIDLRTGRSERVFRSADLAVTEVFLTGDGLAYLAGVEPVGRRARLPVPGRVRIMRSRNLRDWEEAEVDYRAFGRRVTMAEACGRKLWLASDGGIVLERVEE